MELHRYDCSCGKTIEAIGPRSLCCFVRAHEGLGCPNTRRPYVEKTDSDIFASPRYHAPPGASEEQPLVVPVGGPVWTAQDYEFLATLRISVLADLRSEYELATRYKPRHTESR